MTDSTPIARLVLALLENHLPGYEPQRVEILGSGVDHVAVQIDDALIIRLPMAGPASQEGLVPSAEAGLLRAMGGILDVPVPFPVFHDDDTGALGVRRLPGTPLLLLEHALPERALRRLAVRLGGMLADLHGADASATGVDLPIDSGPPSYLESAAEAWDTILQLGAPAGAEGIEAFLLRPPPAGPVHPALCHLDLGSEHLLVTTDAIAAELTGVIDWSDAGVGDPARDLGLLLRDLGPAALEGALDAYGRSGGALEDDENLMARIEFHARCGLLEDLAHGLANGLGRYTGKSLDQLPTVFG